MRRRMVLGAALIAVVALSCDEPPPPDRCALDAGAARLEVVFDPALFGGAAGCEEAQFFDAPFPHELRTDEEGRLDLEGFSSARRGLLADVIEILREEAPGASPITGVYFRLSGAIDRATLPGAPADALAGGSSVVLVDVDPESPAQGERLPAYVRLQESATRFLPEHTLIVRPVPGAHLHPGRRYAVVIRDGLRGEGGEPLTADPRFEALKQSGEGRLADYYGALFDDLEALGIPRESVVAATAFRVSDPTGELDLARAYVQSVPLPAVRWTRAYRDGFLGEVDVIELMTGEPPFTALGEGRIRFDAEGRPLVERRVTVGIDLTVPPGDPPPEGWPVVLYGHGTGGDASTHNYNEGLVLADAGVAMLGFDAAFHGRRSAGVDPGTLVLTNPLAAREMIRQTVIDQMLFLRMLRERRFDVPAALAGEAIALAPSPVLFMGHSQGSQEGGVLLGVEPTVDAAFLSAGGGGAIITVTEGELACAIAAIIREECEDLTEDHPVLTLVLQRLVDPADPLGFAHRVLRERPADWSPLSIAMTEGLLDTSTPPRTVEALAASIGLPIVEPVAQTTDAYLLAGAPAVASPVRANLEVPSSGASITGGLTQWPRHGHFAIYENPAATSSYREYFRTASEALPPIIGP